jgi:LuxR family transcriptional regulator, quorum-sensing system regulator BjaR1
MSYWQRALDFIEGVESAPTIDALEARLRQTLLEFGVTQYSLIALAERPDNKARRPIGLTRGCAPEWSRRYHEKRYFNSDAVIHTAICQSGAFTWKDLAPHLMSAEAKSMVAEGRDIMQVDGCFVVPTHDARGLAGLISMFHPGLEPDQEMRKALKLITIYAVERAKELHGAFPGPAGWDSACPLTPRQREVLAFSAIGKTDWEVSAILGIAQKTANRHFEAAKRELGVATRAQAVAIAMHRGWIAL